MSKAIVLVLVLLTGCSAEFSEQLFGDGDIEFGTDSGGLVEASTDAGLDVVDAVADATTDTRSDTNDDGSTIADIADARDSAQEAMPEAALEAAPDVCASVQHTNCMGGTCPNLGQKFFDCVPVNTFTLTQAHKACVSYASEARCANNPNGVSATCADSTFCWWYFGTNLGRVTNYSTVVYGTWN